MSKRSLIYFFSFIIPVLLFALSYYQLGIYPGGPSTVLIYDMRAQLLAFYGYISNSGPGFDGVFHNMSGGLGGGFLGSLALYVSPFDLIYSIVPLKNIPDAVYCMTLIRVGLSGLFMSIFVSRYRRCDFHPVFIVLVSCCYALMTYNFMYSMSPMWLDLVMFLPLLALTLERIIEGKKSSAFIILLSFCIISDYYISYTVVLAITMYFLFRLIEEGNTIRESFRKVGIFAVHGLISAGISSIIILPVIYDFTRGKLAEEINESKVEFIKNSFVDVMLSFKPSSYSTLEGSSAPNVFCGTVIFILALIWFFAGKKELKARISSLVIFFLYICSFVFGPLDRAWHGFRDPVGFSARYSFTFCFFMVCFAVRGYSFVVKNTKESLRGIIGLVGALCVIYTAFEMFINGSYVFSRLAVEVRFANRKEYNRTCDLMTDLLSLIDYNNSENYSRLCKNFRYSRFDGALFGYDGLERFSSSYNYNTNMFLADLGLGASYHTLGEHGLTPPVASLLNVGYYLSYFHDCSDYYDYIASDQGVELYKNNYSLPLAFGIDNIEPERLKEYGDNPFENINITFSDLLSDDSDSYPVFLEQESLGAHREIEDYYDEDSLDCVDYSFVASNSSSFWLFSEYIEGDERYKEAWKKGEFSDISLHADYYLNNQKIGTYRNDEFTYCDEIGSLEEGKEYTVTLDSSLSEIGDTYIYYYNSDAFIDAYWKILNHSYDVINIDSKGILLKGGSDTDSYVLVSLPFEDGYDISVDGIRTDYIAYRGSLILIPIQGGSHEISIKYVPQGLYFGIVLAVISIMLMIIYCGFPQNTCLKLTNFSRDNRTISKKLRNS